MITRSGPSRFTTEPIARPIAAPASAYASRATGLPPCASSSAWAGPASGSPVSRRIRRTMAESDAMASTQPWLPQWQSGPRGSMDRCPISPATPCAPETTLPLTTRPQPIPAPTVTRAKLDSPTPAPNHCSATVSARTSLSTVVGSPVAAAVSSASAMSRQSRNGEYRTAPAARSTSPDTATARPCTWTPNPSASVFNSAVSSAITAITAPGSRSVSGTWRASRIRQHRSARTAITSSAVTFTPMNRALPPSTRTGLAGRPTAGGALSSAASTK